MASTFKDSTNDEWELSLNLGVAKRVFEKCGIDLTTLVNAENKFDKLGELVADPFKVAGMLFVILKKQIEERKLDEDGFLERITGDALYAATKAFLDEYIDFFPQPKTRESLRAFFQKAEATGIILSTQALNEIQALDPTTMASSIVAGLSGSVGSGQAS